VSVITDVVIVAGIGERESLGYLNRWLAQNDPRGQQLKQVSLSEGGGNKATSVTTYAACFNFLDTGGFTGAIRSAPWHLPAVVVAYFYPEIGETYVMSPARTGEWPAREPQQQK
jgi:hypothetical protein